MLRSGKKISIKHPEIYSNNGLILSPIINLNGLVLRADNPIPGEIKKFLEQNGVKVNRIKYKEELHVRLLGVYHLSASAIEQFIEDNKILVEEQLKNLDAVDEAPNLQAEIAAKINDVYLGKPLQFLSLKLKGATTYSGTDTHITCREKMVNKGRIIANRNMTLTAKKNKMKGEIIPGYNVGFFAESKANNVSKYIGSMEAKNAIIDSGKELDLESCDQTDSFNLELNYNVVWGNNPHKDLEKIKI